MCMSALSPVFSLNQILFPVGGCPWQLSGYRKLGRAFSDILAVTSGWDGKLWAAK